MGPRSYPDEEWAFHLPRDRTRRSLTRQTCLVRDLSSSQQAQASESKQAVDRTYRGSPVGEERLRPSTSATDTGQLLRIVLIVGSPAIVQLTALFADPPPQHQVPLVRAVTRQDGDWCVAFHVLYNNLRSASVQNPSGVQKEVYLIAGHLGSVRLTLCHKRSHLFRGQTEELTTRQ